MIASLKYLRANYTRFDAPEYYLYESLSPHYLQKPFVVLGQVLLRTKSQLVATLAIPNLLTLFVPHTQADPCLVCFTSLCIGPVSSKQALCLHCPQVKPVG